MVVGPTCTDGVIRFTNLGKASGLDFRRKSFGVYEFKISGRFSKSGFGFKDSGLSRLTYSGFV